MKRYSIIFACIAALTSGCGEDKGDTAPEDAWCGLESTVAYPQAPVWPNAWTDGDPFEAGAYTAYADVSATETGHELWIHSFAEGSLPSSYLLGSADVDETILSATIDVQDVAVDGTTAYVFWRVTTILIDVPGSFVEHRLSTVDLEKGVARTDALQLGGAYYRTYQLALQDGVPVIGYLNDLTGETGIIRTVRLNGQLSLVEPETVQDEDGLAAYAKFISFDLTDGVATFVFSQGERLEVETVQYRACE